jgi:4-diphosphocytidyl-2-C-methyl-D-erythritol kinase
MSAREARVEAQAKLNLFLRVLAREESGYHQVETLFCRIALADTITVRATASGRTLDCSGERVPPGGLGPQERNLAWRAASAYAEATGFPSGFEIAIEKRIPVGGGLGGGSADAGGVLRALNTLNPRPIAAPALQQIAASLGADVPFLTQDGSTLALARGRGEQLALLPALPPSAVWLLVPDTSISTADAYRWLDSSERRAGSAAVTADQLTTWAGVAAIAGNDFEPVVSAHVPVVGRLLANLRREEVGILLGPAALVLLSGSGSCVAVVIGERAPQRRDPPPPLGGVSVLETETSEFVEPVVLTH